MPNLVGIGLSQVPTNSMLGGLAYQDPEHASIKDLDLKNLSQINSEIADTAVDVFVYDTSKDSDGGAWRKRTQHTSWYNETLGTATRGTRREFPAVAVIVAEATQITIYDGDDPDLPMWMVFNALGTNSGTPTVLGWFTSGVVTISSISAKNGIIVFGSNGGTVEAFLIKDDFRLCYGTTGWEIDGGWSISKRNLKPSSFTSGTSFNLLSATVNALAMTVLPNAPIDSATGLPTPTIAVATNDGVSVIKDDGTVVDHTDSAGGESTQVTFTQDDKLAHSHDGHTGIRIDSLKSSDFTYGSNKVARHNSEEFYINYGLISSGWSGNTPKLNTGSFNSGGQIVPVQDNILAERADTGLNLLARDFPSSPNDNRVAYATTSYNTGWMQGNIKGAYLSDTDTTNAGSGTEIVSNGTFDSNVTGWDVGSGSISHSSGKLNITGESSWHTVGFTRNYNFTAGETYHIQFTIGGTSARGIIDYSMGTLSPSSGGTPGSSATYYYPNAGTYSILYTPNTATPSLRFVFYNTATDTGTLDNVSITPLEKDRSVNNYGLKVFGTINKSAVATGAELVAYHGFNSSNYLRHRTTINYGNAATITMGGWSKISGSSVDGNYRYLCSCRGSSIPIGVAIHIDNGSSNSGKPYFYDLTNSSLQSDGPRVDDNEWHHILGVLDGTSKKIYIDGELIASATVTGLNLSSVDITNVGHYVPSGNDNPNYNHGGYLALIKFSASAPSAEQIKKMYEDEKFLFQENAACTLYGSSDAVTALAYDEVTERLHVGTSSGRSDFQGLRRINNTTTAVTTAISAHDGFIIEQ